MSAHDVSVKDIAKQANAAMREKDETEKIESESLVAEMCEEFIEKREADWITDVQTYKKTRLRLLYALLPVTSYPAENAEDEYKDVRTNLLRRLQERADKQPQSEKWKHNWPKDHYFILNVKKGEVRPAALRAA
jgi:hypothetical protein